MLGSVPPVPPPLSSLSNPHCVQAPAKLGRFATLALIRL